MPTDRLFKRIAASAAHGGADTVTIEFNGAPLRVPAGCSVAAALLASGVTRFRNSPVSGEPRAPYCMMGACFECLMEIDGQPSRQSCLVTVREGMRVHTQDGARTLPLPAPAEAGHAAQVAHG
ncbi:Putative sarcosine oxidase alpha subunit; 2Fe-2S ferredoxin [Cupriavidus phytorum]|uniref:Sarcosine oxidase alpha subunit 2Fe-2S ferredoxin n=2 Tax=Cupriavidus TaxID=106589 RepID=A0A375CHI7_9BURK|nr:MULTISPECIES: (2Fe-2S)-binding protein [Cupriavidus]PZX34687.1 2Fe-2S iron-sulfur cluster protein [Cupriavidus alkaliphilus]SOY71131.1 Putative sarcosine oxidase alpha subunit; 2Fe-2S ferredoxin [Cupriavidus taiwanensis]